jgi:cyclophilin family peptidyl-prolyl cis-trans isomerase
MRWFALPFGNRTPHRTSDRPASRKRRLPRTRLELEALEDRSLPATTGFATLTGTAFIDANGDGARASTEVTVPGVGLTLTGTTSQGPVTITATTDANGLFTFTAVAGTYTLTAATPGILLGGEPQFGGGVGVGDSVSGITLSAGQSVTQDLGFFGLGPQAISARQFLTNSTAADLQFPTPGSGQGSVDRPPVVSSAIQDVSVNKGSAPTTLDLAGNFSDPDITDTRVVLNTSAGPINIELFDAQAPRTVANFLNYIQSGAYNDSIFHRSAKTSNGTTPFVLQGGGFTFNTNPSRLDQIPTDPAVQNEFDGTNRSNVLGTLAMAKFGNDPNSATDQFFFNLGNNSANLDNQNGGFTVFGKVVSSADQQVVNTLAAIPTRDESTAAALPPSQQGAPGQGVFAEIPLQNYAGTNFPTDTTAANYALVQSAQVVSRGDFLTYSVVSNSNPGLVTPTVKSERLTLTYAAGQSGTATLTVRATDRFGVSVDSTFTVTVTDQPPTASVVLSPTKPQATGTLTATVTASDPDNDPVTLTYVWQVNGTTVQNTPGTSKTTDSLDLSKQSVKTGDTIAVQVTPNDGTVNGDPATASVTVS